MHSLNWGILFFMAITHILNGDALLEQLPASIAGKRIIMRECLMDGKVSAKDWPTFYQVRWQYLDGLTGGLSFEDYQAKSIYEIKKIQHLSPSEKIFLWFEEDLFCQVNLWFCLHIIAIETDAKDVHLVMPDNRSPYSFASYTNAELEALLPQAKPAGDLMPWSQLWQAYRDKNWKQLGDIAIDLQSDWPFLVPAVKAQQDRLENNNYQGRPRETVLNLVKEGRSYPEVFQAFCQTEAIYGFGDLQVKQLYDEAQRLNNAAR